MATDPVHRFHNVPDEDRWRRLFAAWRSHLQGLWEYLDHTEAPWGWSERTNVGLLASAHERTPGGCSMVEIPFRRQTDDADSPGRFDLWFGASGWSVHASWTRQTDRDALRERFRTFEKKLWDRHDKRFRTFQSHLLLPADQIVELDVGRTRPRALPGVILCGRIHKVEKS